MGGALCLSLSLSHFSGRRRTQQLKMFDKKEEIEGAGAVGPVEVKMFHFVEGESKILHIRVLSCEVLGISPSLSVPSSGGLWVCV